MRRAVLSLSLLALGCRGPAHESRQAAASASAAPRPIASAPAAEPAAAPSAEASAAQIKARAEELSIPITQIYQHRRHHWRRLSAVNWQAFDEAPPPMPPDESPPAPRGCPSDMVRVAGRFLVSESGADDDRVLLVQNEACVEWRSGSHGADGLCARFDPARWAAARERLGRRALDLCVDRWEYPNRRGEYPIIVSTYSESRAYCAREGKRLCTESEWTFACEGEAGLPYPYGYERDPSACNFERKVPLDIADDFAPRMLPSTAAALDRAFEGLRSGERPRCVSPFGVGDMTGNVDEWTTSVRRGGYQMILKGGHSGFVRSRCRPATRGHGPLYVNHSQGFRCCADAPP